MDLKTVEEIESNLRQMITILNASCDSEGAMTAKNFQEAQHIFMNMCLSFYHARRFVEKIKDIWPQGERFIQKMNHVLDIMQSLTDNAIEWKEYMLKPNFDSSKLHHALKVKYYVMKNRALGTNFSASFKEASELLESLTSLNLDRLWDEDIAKNS